MCSITNVVFSRAMIIHICELCSAKTSYVEKSMISVQCLQYKCNASIKLDLKTAVHTSLIILHHSYTICDGVIPLLTED